MESREANIGDSKKNKISAISVLRINLIVVDDHSLEWLEAKDFNIAALAKAIGIDVEHKAKAKITVEIIEEPCKICGKMTKGDSLCERCDEVICDQCAKANPKGKYCPICSDIENSPIKV